MARYFYAKTKWQALFEHIADSEAKVFKMTFANPDEAKVRASYARQYMKGHNIGTINVLQNQERVYFVKNY